MLQINDIVETIKSYAPDADLGVVMQAYLLAAHAHQGQTRNTGEAYLTHPMEVARILAEMRMDVDTIATALLHDALEDNPLTPDEMTAQVGPQITRLVEGVTKIGKLKYRSKEELQAENFRKMMLAMSEDIRVILVKLADRLHNMRTLDGHSDEKRRKISQETLDIYVPIANRLGLVHIKSELEDLCISYLDPEVFQAITRFLAETQPQREAYIRKVIAVLEAELAGAAIQGRVTGRAKAISSIYGKVKATGLAVEDVPDTLAFRMIVPDVGACYLMLGLVHARLPPVPGRFKDYIARSKANGYQSLHTTVIGPEGKRIEVQFRTPEMHAVAERGIAAHWRYKEGHLALRPEDVAEISQIRELFEAGKEADDAADFMESVKVAFYADEVFVFTPAGEVKRLPLGATPIDFAFAVHSDVGSRCVGARVNGKMVPLSYTLRSGETVEVMTHPQQRPRRDWLDIARTGRAISKIRRHLRQEEEDEAVRMGRSLLDAELHRFEWTMDRARSEGRLDAYLDSRNHKGVDGLLAEVARGHQPVTDVAKAILPEGVWVSRQDEARRNRLTNLLGLRKARSVSPVRITGEDGVLVQYARCCNPLPGESVVGFITRGRGITVHRDDCKNLADLDLERQVPVEWDTTHRTRHSNTLTITCFDRQGILAAVTKICDNQKVNIERAEARADGKSGSGVITLQLAVTDLAELTKVIRAVERVPGVERVERAQG